MWFKRSRGPHEVFEVGLAPAVASQLSENGAKAEVRDFANGPCVDVRFTHFSELSDGG